MCKRNWNRSIIQTKLSQCQRQKELNIDQLIIERHTQKSVAVSLHNGFKHLLTPVHQIDFVMRHRWLGRPTADLSRATLASVRDKLIHIFMRLTTDKGRPSLVSPTVPAVDVVVYLTGLASSSRDRVVLDDEVDWLSILADKQSGSGMNKICSTYINKIKCHIVTGIIYCVLDWTNVGLIQLTTVGAYKPLPSDMYLISYMFIWTIVNYVCLSCNKMWDLFIFIIYVPVQVTLQLSTSLSLDLISKVN